MIAYKLIRKMRDGYSPLFINKKTRLQIGEWSKAEYHPTTGFKGRKGWHCTTKPIAPHLSEGGSGVGKNRVWVQVEVKDIEYFERPNNQGGLWILAQEMKIIKQL